MALQGSPPIVLTHWTASKLAARGLGPPPSVLASEKALLGGKKAKTPIIAGSICGGLVFIAWLIGFGIYFRKRYNRKQRNRAIAAGNAAPREKDLELAKEKIVIPPDPAILLGQCKPGDIAFPERENAKGHHHLPWSHHDVAPVTSEDSSQLPASSSSLKGPPTSLSKESPPKKSALETKESSIEDEMDVPATL